VSDSFESASIFPADAIYSPPLATKDSAFLISEVIVKVLDAGMKVKAEVKFSVVLLDVVIKIGDRLAPAPFVI
jgi:hypothetical protein